MTEQRKLITKIVGESDTHPTADDIFCAARAEMPSIALGTVYRNLTQMVAAGEIKKIEMPVGADRYDKTVLDHDHLVCSVCGKAEDIFIPALFSFLKECLPSKQLCNYRLRLSHICEDCANQKT